MTTQDLHQRFLTSNGVSTDTRSIAQGQMFFALKGENFNGNLYAEKALTLGASYAVVDEEISANYPNLIVVQDVLRSLQDLATYHRHFCTAKVIGITGSNGKTTTKELLYAVMSSTYNTQATIGNLNNHIGVPLTLLKIKASTEIAIVEMGANKPGDIEELCDIAQPDYGYITNIGEAHLEGLGSLQGVYETKTALFRSVVESGITCIVNQYDEYLSQSVLPTEKRYDLLEGIELHNQSCAYFSVDYDGMTIDTQLTGEYNLDNVRAAITIGHLLGVSNSAIVSAIESYQPRNHRSQLIDYGNYRVLLDAYNANPTSMMASLKNAVQQAKEYERCIAIIGDMLELGEYSEMRHQDVIRYAVHLGFDQIILVGSLMVDAYHRISKDINIESTTLTSFNSVGDLKPFYHSIDKRECLVFLKGSRGIKLEKLLED